MSDYVLYGSGEHGKVVADALMCLGKNIIGFVDDRVPEKPVFDLPYLGNWDSCYEKYASYHWHVSIGNNLVRSKLFDRIELQLKKTTETIVHPAASVSRFAQLADGCFVAAQAVVGPDVVMGRGVIVNHAATVDHDNHLGDFVHICPGVHMGGNVVICDQTMIGIGSSIIPGVSIGENVVVGGGSVVIKSIDPETKVVGNPTKNIN